MIIDSIGCMGPCQLVARYDGAAVGGLPSLVRTAMILLPLMRYGRLLMARTLML